MGGAMTGIWTLTWFDFEQFFSILFFLNVLEKPVALERVMATITYRVSEKNLGIQWRIRYRLFK